MVFIYFIVFFYVALPCGEYYVFTMIFPKVFFYKHFEVN